MNIGRTNPKGIDVPIQDMQNYLYGVLKPLWNCTDATLNMYARVYNNQTKDGYVPERFVGGKDYIDSFFDDTLAANAFFGVGSKQTASGGSFTADVFLIFQVNLNRIKPNTDRDDEGARFDVETLALNHPFGFEVQSVVTGIDNVYKEYSGWKAKDGIKFRDEHPLHCFRLNFKLLYNIKN